MIPEGPDAKKEIVILHRHVYRQPAAGSEDQPLITLPCSSLALAVLEGLEVHKLLQSCSKRTREEDEKDSESLMEVARRLQPKPRTEVCVLVGFPFHRHLLFFQ